jgi:hypothetical protein
VWVCGAVQGALQCGAHCMVRQAVGVTVSGLRAFRLGLRRQ